MNLLEEFTLLAHDDVGRRTIDGTRLDYALAGALLLELALTERVEVAGRKVVVRDATPVGDPLVDEALARIDADHKARTPRHWLQKLGKGTRQRVLDHLVAAEVLRVEHGSVLLVFPRTRYPSVDGAEPGAETDARERMRAAVTGEGPADARTSALCALVAATEMDRKVFAGMDRRLVKSRLKTISEGAWAATAVRKAIQEVQAAVTSAAVAGAVVAAGS